MSTALTRLLQGLPASFDRDPGSALALSITYSGTTALATVTSRTLHIAVTGGPGTSVSLTLSGQTLATLAATIAGITGFTAAVTGEDAEAGALRLLPVTNHNLIADSRLFQATNPVWLVLAPLGWALEDLLARIKAGLLEMVVRTADGPWLDLWGTEYYGGVYRKPGESDADYATRIIREVVRIRLNAEAIEQIALEDLGIVIEITNLHDKAWVVSRTAFGYLAGRKYSRFTFEVSTFGDLGEVARLVDRNRAAGTLPFYRAHTLIEIHTTLLYEAHLTIRTTAFIGTDLVWTVGVDPLGMNALSRAGNYTIIATAQRQEQFSGSYRIVGEAGTIPFQLDISELDGTDIIL